MIEGLRPAAERRGHPAEHRRELLVRPLVLLASVVAPHAREVDDLARGDLYTAQDQSPVRLAEHVQLGLACVTRGPRSSFMAADLRTRSRLSTITSSRTTLRDPRVCVRHDRVLPARRVGHSDTKGPPDDGDDDDDARVCELCRRPLLMLTRATTSHVRRVPVGYCHHRRSVCGRWCVSRQQLVACDAMREAFVPAWQVIARREMLGILMSGWCQDV